MGKDQLKVTALALGDGVWSRDGAAALRGDFLVGSGFEIKVLRHKTLVLEWYRQEPMNAMITWRTKLEIPLSQVAGASLQGKTLTVVAGAGGSFAVDSGKQPWDGAKRQRAKVTWGAGEALPEDLVGAARSETVLVAEVGNTEARLKKDLAALLACGWNPALGNPRTAVPLGSAPAVDAPKRRFGEEEAYLDALCPEGARGLLGPLLGLAPPKKAKVGRAKPRGVTDATNAQGA